MSNLFGMFRVQRGVEVGRFLGQETWASGEEAVKWLEENAGGIWGKGEKVSDGKEWGGGGVWVFVHQAARKEKWEQGAAGWQGASGERVYVRRLDEREVAESREAAEKIARMKDRMGGGKSGIGSGSGSGSGVLAGKAWSVGEDEGGGELT